MAKGIAGRKRPYVYNTSLSVDERYAIAGSSENDVFFSFFSGHVAAAFAAAAFTSKVFMDIHGSSTWSYLIWGSTLSLAAMTGYARVKAGVHFPSDVIAGALAGGAVGYLVPALHKRSAADRLSLNVSATRWSLQLRF
jgi:membrane-associated phospholipid phosphatase